MRDQSQASRNVSLRRKIDRLVESISRVNDQLFVDGVSDANLSCLEIDAERLADYCRFVRKSRSNKNQW